MLLVFYFQNESNIYFFLICTLVVKNRKGPSFDELLKKIFLFAKVANFLLFFYADLRLAILYSVACMGKFTRLDNFFVTVQFKAEIGLGLLKWALDT